MLEGNPFSYILNLSLKGNLLKKVIESQWSNHV